MAVFKLGCNDKGVMRYIKTTKERIPRMLRTFGIEFYRQVMISTPVDTGRARYSWMCSVDMPNFSIAPEAPVGWIGQSAGGSPYYSMDAMRAMELFTKDAVKADSRIYVVNALPYIEALNNGHSRQAPARFVEMSFEVAVKKLQAGAAKGIV